MTLTPSTDSEKCAYTGELDMESSLARKKDMFSLTREEREVVNKPCKLSSSSPIKLLNEIIHQSNRNKQDQEQWSCDNHDTYSADCLYEDEDVVIHAIGN